MMREMAERLGGLSDSVWDKYALRNEPFLFKLTDEMKSEFLEKSHRCGSSLAAEIIATYGRCRPSELAGKLGAEITYISGSDTGAYTIFSYFEPPNQIFLYQETADKAVGLFSENDLGEFVGNADIREVMAAHELFHYLEHVRDDLYVSQGLLKLKGFLNRERSVHIHALEEVAAMQFAKDLIPLCVNPFVFDVLLLYPINRAMAERLYKRITAIKV